MTSNICNDGFATFEFQRTEKGEDGVERYLWYQDEVEAWYLTDDSNFQARNNRCWMNIKTKGQQKL